MRKSNIIKRKEILLNGLISNARHYMKYGNREVFENIEDILKFDLPEKMIIQLVMLEKNNLNELNNLDETYQSFVKIYFENDRGLNILKDLKERKG